MLSQHGLYKFATRHVDAYKAALLSIRTTSHAMSTYTVTLELINGGGIVATAAAFDDARPPIVRATYFHASEQIHRGRSNVQKGTLTCEGSGETVDAICKFTTTHLNELRDEGELYAVNLRELQGIHVPICYGYFESPCRDTYGRKRTMGFLLLEYCGETLDWELEDTPEDIQYVSLRCLRASSDAVRRINIIEAVGSIHDAGVQHNDIKPDNILVSDADKIRIVDFDMATPHQCKGDLPVNLYAYEPFEDEFGCYELFEIVQEFGLWTPSKHNPSLFSCRPSLIRHTSYASIHGTWVFRVRVPRRRCAPQSLQRQIRRLRPRIFACKSRDNICRLLLKISGKIREDWLA